MLSTRESLILTAIDVIDELGIQGLSTREVAKRLGMSNAVLFSHFKSKNQLLLAVLDHFIQYDKAIIQAIHVKGLKGKEAIIYLMDSFVTYYENYPAITAIMQAYDGFRCEPVLAEKINDTITDRASYVEKMAEEAKQEGQIRSELDITCVADIIWGSFRMICLKWRISNYDFALRERMLYTLKTLLDSFS